MTYEVYLDKQSPSVIVILKKVGNRHETFRELRVYYPRASSPDIMRSYLAYAVRWLVYEIIKKEPFMTIGKSEVVIEITEEEYELLVALKELEKWYEDRYFHNDEVSHKDTIDILNTLEYLQAFHLLTQGKYAELTERIRRVLLSKEI